MTDKTLIDINSSHNYSSHSCSYSDTPRGSTTCGFECDQMTAADYGDMMERGFRRCGTYFYCPDNMKMHWGWFTIRMEAAKHKIRKSHQKAWNRWQRFLKGERGLPEEGDEGNSEDNNKKVKVEEMDEEKPTTIVSEVEHKQICELLKCTILKNWETIANSAITKELSPEEKNIKFNLLESLKSKVVVNHDKKEPGVYFSNILVLFNSILKLDVKSMISQVSSTIDSNLNHDSYTTKVMPNGIVRWLPLDYGNLIDQENPKKLQKSKSGTSNSKPCEPHKFEMKIVKALCTTENFKMYQSYCKMIHEKENEYKSGYENFLCLTNLIERNIKSSTSDKELPQGCFHMNYYLDGTLIAVGVVDMVLKGMSSVYFFYDPKYKPLKMGIVAGLYEIEYIQEMQKVFPLFKYYYLGFYIQQTEKMVYKADFEPCELLCPKTKRFVVLTPELRKGIDNGQRILDTSTVSSEDQSDKEFSSRADIAKTILDNGKIVYNDELLSFKTATHLKGILDQIVKLRDELFMAIGKKLTKRIILTL